MSLPDFLRWRLVLLRVLEVTLWAPPGVDFVFHVPGDVRGMQERAMPSVFALWNLCCSLWEAREQKVLLVHYRPWNLLKPAGDSLKSEKDLLVL
jgi:hypothetical protein